MEINLKKLDTEKINNKSKNIDKESTLDIVKIINDEDKSVPLAVERELPKIANAVDVIVKKLRAGGRLIYIGAGTSGRLGVLDASECPPTYGVSHELVQGIMAGGEAAMFKAKEGAEDSKELAVEDLNNISFSDKDVLVGLAASGRTPYVIGALEHANSIGARTVSVSCVQNAEVSEVAEIGIEAVVGAEVVTGSTRMKAGTAQKMVLNMLSTGTMIKLGKVYGNLMIDVRPTNEKLVQRAKNIIKNCTKCSEEEAEELLSKSENDVRVAIFMKLSNLNREKAIEVLERNDNSISKALEEMGA